MTTQPDKCPTCGSDDRNLLGLDVTSKPSEGHWRQVRCAVPTYTCCDPWHAGHTQVEAAPRPEPPLHAYEVTIHIGANTWEYAQQAAQEASEYVAERKPEHVNLSSGGWDGCYSVCLQMREITPDDYRKELQEWSEKK